MGVPQYRFRDTAQSLAFVSQLANLLACTNSGTLDPNIGNGTEETHGQIAKVYVFVREA